MGLFKENRPGMEKSLWLSDFSHFLFFLFFIKYLKSEEKYM
jgi:hypothetical protein